MNEIIKKLGDEFEKMGKTIALQQKVIASIPQTPACPLCRVPESGQINVFPNIPKMKLDGCSWYEIAMYAQSGMADKLFATGDTKAVTLTNGSVIHVRIIGSNHDENDIGQFNPLTFESVETLNEDFCMNEKMTNEGGWEKSLLRSRLNGHFFNSLLPDDLKAVIKPTAKLTSTGGRNPKMGKTIDKLFVLSEQEIFGRKIYSLGGEGRWYDWYKRENTEYGKCKQSGERDWRWERSPYSGYATFFCYVNSSGGAGYGSAGGSLGVSFGFCV